jgi:hypothetical protein
MQPHRASSGERVDGWHHPERADLRPNHVSWKRALVWMLRVSRRQISAGGRLSEVVRRRGPVDVNGEAAGELKELGLQGLFFNSSDDWAMAVGRWTPNHTRPYTSWEAFRTWMRTVKLQPEAVVRPTAIRTDLTSSLTI